MISHTARKEDVIIYQQTEDGVSEPALFIEPFNDVICINQEGRFININYETVVGLCKLLKELKSKRIP